MTKHLSFLASIFVFAACSGGTTTPTDPGGGGGIDSGPAVIAGQIRLSSNVTGTDAPLADIVPGELIVKFKPGLQSRALSSLSVAGIQVAQVRPMALASSGLYRAAGINAVETRALAHSLEARGDVLYAQPNRHLRATAVPTPTDTFFPLQWDLQPSSAQIPGGMNVTGAWDAHGTGVAGTVVAVVDTGILFNGDASSDTHPDLIGRVLPGYDFVSDARSGSDGDGRDPNPFDPPTATTSYHGSHVAGTIMASANNVTAQNNGGIVGINWAAKLLPVRVLGSDGRGSTADILDGMAWAAGLTVNGVPANAHPADVINLSLGGEGGCGPAEQDFYTQVLNAPQKPIVVVASGNSNQDALGFTPASCAGVLTVGASDQFGARAPYSNYGARIDVMAPGGNTSQAFKGEAGLGGILSLFRNDQGAMAFRPLQGTSMAAPHVAGLASLMRGLNPGIDTAQMIDILKRPGVSSGLDAAKCDRPQGSDCGPGLIDAKLALDALQTGGNTPDFTLGLSNVALTIAPGGTSKITISIRRQNGFADPVNLTIPVPVAGITTAFNPATASASSELSITIAANLAPGTYNLSVRGTAAGLSKSQALSIKVAGANDLPNLKDTDVLSCIFIASQCAKNTAVGVTITSSARQAAYSLGGVSSSGNYIVLAVKDVNGNNKIDAGDYLGGYLTTDRSSLALVRPRKTDVSFDLERVVTTTSLEDRFGRDAGTVRQMLETYLAEKK